jgi:hypothetical protein
VRIDNEEVVAITHQIVKVSETLSVFAGSNALKCVRISKTGQLMAFTEQISMNSSAIRENDLLTLKAHRL